MIKLKQLVNGAVVAEFDLSKDDFTIGRNDGNSLQLDDGVVSGEHAVIKLEPSAYVPEWFDISISDLGSTNGTYVNNTEIKQQAVKHGDVIRIGTYEFKVFDDKATDSTQTAFHVPEQWD